MTKPFMLYDNLGITTICGEYTSTRDAKRCQPIGILLMTTPSIAQSLMCKKLINTEGTESRSRSIPCALIILYLWWSPAEDWTDTRHRRRKETHIQRARRPVHQRFLKFGHQASRSDARVGCSQIQSTSAVH